MPYQLLSGTIPASLRETPTSAQLVVSEVSCGKPRLLRSLRLDSVF